MVFLSSGPQGNGRGRKPSSVVGRSSIYSPRRREALAISLEARRAAVSLLVGSCIGWGLQRNRVATARVSSYLAFPALPGQKPGRYISVALSLESPPPAVSWHPALRCSDFPHGIPRDRLAAPLPVQHSTPGGGSQAGGLIPPPFPSALPAPSARGRPRRCIRR